MMLPEEQKRFEAYEKACRDQARNDREYAERPFLKPSLAELLNALENEALDSIREANSDIGLMLKCKERFRGDQAIKDLTNYFCTLARYQIEEDHNDIQRWREYKKSCRV
jgi:hypothetical protein